MWSNNFDDFAVESRIKRRKIEKTPSSSSTLKIKEPITIEDLATHSKKIAEVRGWLEYAANSPEILLLTGPAGSTKTVTLKVVAETLGVKVQEWVNPLEKLEYKVNGWLEPDPYDSAAYTEPKQIDKFESFVFRSSRYQTLFSSDTKRIILVEDFPNHFIWKPSIFFEFLSKYKSLGQCPIVFICTDDENINLSTNLFPNSIREFLKIVNIKFNPLSYTALMKVLTRSAEFLPKETLSDIAKASNGDIRTALSNIQFLLVGNIGLPNGVSGAPAKDVSTDFYQTMGRVLYPKRRSESSPGEPTFLYDVNIIAQHFNGTFLSMLQENFLNTFSSLKDIIEGCAILSDCDLFSKGGDELEKYAGLTCVIGLMVANKLPKKGSFKPMGRSRWASKAKTNNSESRAYPQLQMTCRTLNVDVIPYIKHFPQFADKLAQSDADRLRTLTSGNKIIPLFKAPPPPPSTQQKSDDDELIIEEFED